MAFLAEGLRRLHAVERPAERLWRGLRNVTGEISNAGGTELAPLSFTPSLATAARFAAARSSLIMLVRANALSKRGASLQFLSTAPHEQEVCYPPCTFLRPTGRTQLVDVGGGRSCSIIEVEPHLG